MKLKAKPASVMRGAGMRRIKYASDCSGVDSGAVALETMGARVKHLWASDASRACRRVLAHNYDIGTIYDDVQSKFKDVEATEAVPDLYASGPPCQPVSRAGKQLGIKDPRALPFFGVIRTIAKSRPKTFVIENVPQIAKDKKHTKFWKLVRTQLTGILDKRGSAAYNIYTKELNSRWHGVPQARKRRYIVGVLRSAQVTPFQWPADTAQSPGVRTCLLPNPRMLPTKTSCSAISFVEWTSSTRMVATRVPMSGWAASPSRTAGPSLE